MRILSKLLAAGLITLSVFTSSGSALHGQQGSQDWGTAVLVDISGSMRYGGNWRDDVRQSLQDLLFGGRLDTLIWRTDGVLEEEGERFLDGLKAGQPLYHLGQPLLMVAFGEAGSRYPYFSSISVDRFSDLNAGSQFYRQNFPRSFDDDWTYLLLAKAIARDQMRDVEKREWYSIVISDFEEDVPPDDANLDPYADSLANAYETTIREQALVTFAYARDRRLKMRIWRVEYPGLEADEDTSEPPPLTGAPIQLLQPSDGQVISEINRESPLQFRWSGVAGVDRYTVTLFEDDGSILQRVGSDRPLHSLIEPLPPGSYSWRVEGRRETGERAISNSRSFEVRRSAWPVFVWILLAIAAVILLGVLRTKGILKRKQPKHVGNP